MYQVHVGNRSSFFKFFGAAKSFAKAAGLWYYITDGVEIIYTQDDEILEGLQSES